MFYGGFKDLSRRKAVDNVLRDKAFNIAKNPKYDGHQRGHWKNYTKQLLENLTQEKYIHLLYTIFGAHI